MTPADEKRLSKFLSLVLRHDPGAAGVTLDPEGWVDLDALIVGAASKGKGFTREELSTVVANSDKKRFTISPGGRSIRAAQGHSVAVDLSLAPVVPPAVLFHGTAERNVASIQTRGLHAGSRRHVHLSPDIETALRVGRRHGRPAVFFVDAARAWTQGHRFYRSENDVWLTDPLPAIFLDLVDDA
ncbi:MAG: RNA 2'-phosphotransferase [Rhodobacteraceae bacterium]|jgi:putative RNA 2'-phosphotransferase|uniref:RNA 2'-phosphotransferase n=1 Tax=Albidovulum sp. TaxID=1872424 RepID=UPI001D281919|nr:RNA 2'-phosphotransferase [uncultured Defluviimonas sp.]MCB2127150.1 RNA 2'-phosphotransferase [Paracoccaceae bacterium]MCC0069512.1 RNA 2'-phosphotransferase [Paracoccaceae bacterium]